MASKTTCQHCTNIYQDPRILSCLHSYCLECVSKLHIEGTASIICPSCNQSTELSDGVVTSLPRNIRLSEETKQEKVLEIVTSTSPSPCDSCGENSPVAYCTECDDLLCSVCWEHHQALRKTRSHSSFKLQEAQNISQDKYSLSSSTSPVCQDHEDQKLDLYCQQCSIPVCVKCILVSHKNHSIVVSNHAMDQRDEINVSLEGFPMAQQQLEEVITAGKVMKEKIKARKNEVDATIRQAFSKLQQLLHQREEHLLAKSSEEAMAKDARLAIQLEGVQSLLDSMSNCHNLASVATSKYGDVELLSISHTLHNRATRLQQQFSEISLDLCESPNISVEVNTDTLGKIITNFGCVSDISPSNSTAVIPRRRLAVGAEMKVKVVSRNSRGQELDHGGAIVTATLTHSDKGSKECQVTDNNDGTYCITVSPELSGQHKLSITIHSQDIQCSPFDLSVVTQHDNYEMTEMKVPPNNSSPRYIAFSDNGDMFVTRCYDHCIDVYDSSRKKKTTIGCKGSGELQFHSPCGIAITGEIVYVAESGGHRIHKLTTGGEFLGTFGQKGSNVGEFITPWGINISPEGNVYVADTSNNRIQIFYSDWTLSHIIDGKDQSFSSPKDISFDLSGDVHVVAYGSNSVKVFTCDGQFVRKYGETHLKNPNGIAIDSAGYSLVTNSASHSLSIFNPSGTFICSVTSTSNSSFYFTRIEQLYGVSLSPDGLVWVAGVSKTVRK